MQLRNLQSAAVKQLNAVMHVQQADLIAGHFIARHARDHLIADAVAGIAHRDAHPIAVILNRQRHCTPLPRQG